MSNENGPRERRRRAIVVHDSRGNARVEWQPLADDDPRATQRMPLSLTEDKPPQALEMPVSGRPRSRADLQRLSEWIKLTRNLQRGPKDD